MPLVKHNNEAKKVKVLDYTYTSQPSINTALPLQFSVVKGIFYVLGVILSFGFIWLLTKWSARKKAILIYNVVELENATYFLIQDQQTIGGSTLVHRLNKRDIISGQMCVAFNYHDRHYLFHPQKQVFAPIQYTELGLHLDKLKKGLFVPHSKLQRHQLLEFYGDNVIRLQVQRKYEVFIQKMLTPYEVFQLYTIILWIYELYIIFAICLLIYALYMHWANSSQVTKNQQKLSDESYFQTDSKVLVSPSVSTTHQLQEFPLQALQGCQIIQTSSHSLVPGDLMILEEGDIVPCDCILIKGELLVDESYTTGESYMVRKKRIQNCQYSKQYEQDFLLYLGTRIVKDKPSTQQHILSRVPHNIICLVTHTNYSTIRGKFLRAVRYQKKQPQTFTLQTIYFIYIIFAITLIVFLALLPTISILSSWDLLITFLDLLSTSVPPTLPTVLSVGISFAQHRLKKCGVNCVLSLNILTAGRTSALVLEGFNVFGRNYDIESVVLGIKKNRNFGYVFNNREDMFRHCCLDNNSIIKEELLIYGSLNKQEIISRFVYALTACHTLEFINDRIQGSIAEKKAFAFAGAEPRMDQDTFQVLNHFVHTQTKILFEQKDKMLAVVAIISQHEMNTINRQEQFQLLEGQYDDNYPKAYRETFSQDNKKIIFIKGPPEKILKRCNPQSYPLSSFQYILDMAEKGFNLICYASKPFLEEEIQHQGYTFLGFVVFQQRKQQQNQEAMTKLKNAQIRMILISEQRQLETNSLALRNSLCTKNELLLCNVSKDKKKIYCRGHTQWQSTQEDYINQFVHEYAFFGKGSYLSITSELYEQLFIKTNEYDHLFKRILVLNKMKHRHERNLYMQLEKYSDISFAIGGGKAVSQCANVSLQLQRTDSSLLSSFYTNGHSLLSIVHILRICRAALATNFHCFSMTILFSLIQFTTVTLLAFNYQCITENQNLYEDLFITFPIFVTINMIQPTSRLSTQKPFNSFFSTKALSSMIGQLIIQFLAQLSFIFYLLTYSSFQTEKDNAQVYFIETGQFTNTDTALAFFVFTNYLYLGIVLSTSVSKPFRKPFYMNLYYTTNLVLIWIYNSLIVLFPSIAPSSIRQPGRTQQTEFALMIAIAYGNIIMAIMFIYENTLDWIQKLYRKCCRKSQKSLNQL